MKRFIQYIVAQADDDNYWRDEEHRNTIIREFEVLVDYQRDLAHHYDIYFTPFNPNFCAAFDGSLRKIHKSIVDGGNNPWQVKTYIETGIHLGGSLTLAEICYGACIGVEINEVYYLINKYHVFYGHETTRNTQIILGDSREVFPKIFKEKNQQGGHWDEYTLIFLDAHWGENPLSKELKSISDFKLSPAGILIDDCHIEGDEILHNETGEEYSDIPKKGKYMMERWMNVETGKYECAKHEYFEPMIDKIYGKGNYTTTFIDSDRGVGMIFYQPNKNHPRYEEKLS